MLVRKSQPLNYLDLIPDKLYQRLITHQYHNPQLVLTDNHLEIRCSCILQIRDALLAGQKIHQDTIQSWVEDSLVTKLYRYLSSKDLLLKTKNNTQSTDECLLNLLDWLDAQSGQPGTGKPESVNSHLPQSTEQKTAPSETSKNQFNQDNSDKSKQVHNELNQLEIDPADLDKKLQAVYKSFAVERHLGWDLTQGIESDNDVKLILDTHRHISKSAQLASIIQLIGRGKQAKNSMLDGTGLDLQQQQGERQSSELPNDFSVNSVTGTYMGDDLARMLPSQLSMLGHPALRLLWHARRAEKQLLNYHIKGVLSEHIPEVRQQHIASTPGSRMIQQQGPMIVCVDTSASMKGRPEQMAKAVALECARVARLEQRACYLIFFSGQGELRSYELDFEKAGWQPVIDFLRHSFHGGTDIKGSVLHALQLSLAKKWRNADIAIVSDGRFNPGNELAQQVKLQHASIRIFGIQVASWRTTAFERICHQVFVLNKF